MKSVFLLLGLLWLAAARHHPTETITHKVYFDLAIDGTPAGRVVMGLYGKLVPKTVQNFRGLCTGEFGKTADGVKMHYKNTTFHRVISGFIMQGGDYTKGDGTGGESIYAKPFLDESFALSHNGRGILSMANSGPNSNLSQFFITFAETLWLDYKHVAFGEVLDGFEVLDKVEATVQPEGEMTATVLITDSGELPIDKLTDRQESL